MNEEAAHITSVFAEAIQLHERVSQQPADAIVKTVDAIVGAFDRGGKVLIFGNGGSAADSQHLAAELVGRFVRERRALPAIALTTDSSVVTSISNDYAFDRVFARQIEALGHANDVAVGISTSGVSTNVVAGFAAAQAKGMITVAFTGRDGGPIGAAADIHLNVPSSSTARVQEVHRTLLHIVCDLIERRLEEPDARG